VYEPLSSFDATLVPQLTEAASAGRLNLATVGDHEREMWLTSQFPVRRSLLPGERRDGTPSASMVRDVLVLDPADVPNPGGATVGPGPMICPLDVRARSAAALAGFVAGASPALLAESVPVSVDRVHAKALEVLGSTESHEHGVHVVSTTWTVPLPWFCIVDPETRRVVVATREDPARQVSWRVAMADARRRVARALSLATRTFGDEGPSKVLHDTGRWLEQFHAHSAVELDYGGVVQLLDDEQLVNDSSAEDVHAIVQAIEDGDATEMAARFDKLRDFWGTLAIRERFN
jgi:hypothetical protein